jgi:hypothetical protein
VPVNATGRACQVEVKSRLSCFFLKRQRHLSPVVSQWPSASSNDRRWLGKTARSLLQFKMKLLANGVTSRRCSKSIAFEAMRTLSRIYQHTA